MGEFADGFGEVALVWRGAGLIHRPLTMWPQR
jgi:hypothetical protein